MKIDCALPEASAKGVGIGGKVLRELRFAAMLAAAVVFERLAPE